MVSMTDAQLQHHIVPTGAFNLCNVYLYVLQDARKSNTLMCRALPTQSSACTFDLPTCTQTLIGCDHTVYIS